MTVAKARILEAASDLFLDGGLQALSVRAIARRAGLSTIGIYSHFQGKQGILDTLYIEGFERVHAAIDIEEEGLTPVEAIMKATGRYLDSAADYEAHYRLIFGESDTDYQPSPEAYAAGARAFNRLTELVAGILPQRAKWLAKQQAALQVWAMVHGYVSLRHHAISELIDIRDWKKLTLTAVRMHVEALANRRG